MSDKIKRAHLERDAWVYVRQSTAHQVEHHRESQARQRALRERALRLGWVEPRVHVIEDDLGQSGASTQARPGYQRLVDAVCERRAGVIFALEASRLARNNADWTRLVELCQHQQVLLADDERVYDPSHPDDRVLLGLQGTLAEYEWDVLRRRAQEAIRVKAERGEFYTCVATGYVATTEGGLDKHPDQRVQHALTLVFSRFEQVGRVRELYGVFCREQILLPLLPPGKDLTPVEWRRPTYQRLLDLLKNPIYAGAYVHGRTQTQVQVRPDAQIRKTTGHRVPRAEWTVLIQDHHPGYITWDQYERNLDKIGHNANMRGRAVKRAVQRGESLLAGLLQCARCGRALLVRYSGRRVRYSCQGPTGDRHRSGCVTFPAPDVDGRVSQEVLDVVQPAGVQAAVRAGELLAQEHAQRRQTLADQREQARYEAERAFRQYDRIEPENRLVAAELERRWNEKLTVAAEAQAQLSAFDQQCPAPSSHDLKTLQELGANLRRVWSDPRAHMAIKKRIVRTLIEGIVVDLDEQAQMITLTVHWSGGAHTDLHVPTPRRQRQEHTGQLDETVKSLRRVMGDEAIARELNRHGLTTATGKTWTAQRVVGYRRSRGIASFRAADKAAAGLLLQCEAATKLGVSPMSIHRLIQRGILPAEQSHVGLACIIHESDLTKPEVLRAIEAIKRGNTPPLPGSDSQPQLFD